MALKFRRGTTAQKSGSLAFGEPYVNTTLGTLQIGGDTGDITLAGTSATVGISGSSLDITGNAKIDGNLILGGNITIGDAGTDTIAINADLSSSLIPNNDNAFTIGTSVLRYSNIYGVNIIGSIAATNGVVSGSSQVIGILSSLNTFSGSQLTQNSTLATYTGSVEGRFTTLATLTGSNSTRLTNLETTTASLNTSITNLNSFSASENTKSSTLGTYTASVESRFTTLASVTASLIVDTNNLETFSGSQLTQNSSLATITGSLILSASNLTQRVAANESVSSSYARTNSANVFTGNQTITGSVYITQDLVVGGSSSVQTISSSRLDIGDNIILLNVASPFNRFGGLAIQDSGSATGVSASVLWDSVNNKFLYSHPSGADSYNSAWIISGPVNSGALGSETGLTVNKIVKATDDDHIGDSQISDDGTKVSIAGALNVTGSVTASAGLVNGTLTLSGDLPRLYLTDTVHNDDYSIINTDGTFTIYDDTTSTGKFKIYSTGLTEITGPLSVTGVITGSIAATNGVVSGSSQVISILSSLNSYTASNDTTNTSQNTSITNLNSATASLQIETSNLETFSASVLSRFTTLGTVTSSYDGRFTTLASVTASYDGRFTTLATYTGSVEGRFTTIGTVTASYDGRFTTLATTSGSLQTSVSNLNTYTSSFAAASVTLTNKTISGASNTLSNIANASLTNSSVTVTAGTGMSGGGAVSLGGTVTLTNAGVTSITGTANQVVASASTGGVTLSLPQSIHSAATPTFAGLTINGAITATGDITAYFTSDKRHKNNIQTIANAVLKVKQLNGVTWEWNDDVNEVTKSTPKTGLIAQEVQQVLPQVVIEKADGYLGLDYSKMMGLLVEAIKEQQIQIDQLKAQISYR